MAEMDTLDLMCSSLTGEMTDRRRNQTKGGGGGSYSSFKSDMKSVIDAAALQHDIAQRFSLPGSKMAIQVSLCL
jgi:hypothetical protein